MALKFKDEESDGEFIAHDEAISYTFFLLAFFVHSKFFLLRAGASQVDTCVSLSMCMCMPPISGGLIAYAIAQRCSHIVSTIFVAAAVAANEHHCLPTL